MSESDKKCDHDFPEFPIDAKPFHSKEHPHARGYIYEYKCNKCDERLYKAFLKKADSH